MHIYYTELSILEAKIGAIICITISALDRKKYKRNKVYKSAEITDDST